MFGVFVVFVCFLFVFVCFLFDGVCVCLCLFVVVGGAWCCVGLFGCVWLLFVFCV